MKAFLPWLFALTLILGAALPGRAEDYAAESHSGTDFYTAEQKTAIGLFTYFVGARDGYSYLFAFSGARSDGSFSEIGQLMDELTF